MIVLTGTAAVVVLAIGALLIFAEVAQKTQRVLRRSKSSTFALPSSDQTSDGQQAGDGR